MPTERWAAKGRHESRASPRPNQPTRQGLVALTYPHLPAERTIFVVLTDNRGRERRDGFERRRTFISGYVSFGDSTSRNALRCRSFHIARVFPQTEQTSCPGAPSFEAHSAIKYEDPHLGHVISEIFITQYSTRIDRNSGHRCLTLK